MTTTKKTAGAAGAEETAGLPTLDPKFGAAYGQSMLELQREFILGMGQLQRDYLTFVSERMRKDIDVAKRMAECRDMKAAVELQSAFVETAREDYLEEAQKLLVMGRDLTETYVQRLAEVPKKVGGGETEG